MGRSEKLDFLPVQLDFKYLSTKLKEGIDDFRRDLRKENGCIIIITIIAAVNKPKLHMTIFGSSYLQDLRNTKTKIPFK